MNKTAVTGLLILVLLLSACVRPFSAASKETIIPEKSEFHPALKNIPVYPNSTAWREGIPTVANLPEDLTTYSYVAEAFKVDTLVEFYTENMTDAGWELFQEMEDHKTKSADLMFSKDKTVAHFQMIPWTANSYLVSVVFYDEAAIE